MNPNTPKQPHTDFVAITPQDVASVLTARGYQRTAVQPGLCVYVKTGAYEMFAVCTDRRAPEYARVTARVVEKLLEVFGPRAVYELWAKQAEREAEAEHRAHHIYELSRATGYGDVE